MPITPHHTRLAGFMSNILAIALLTLPIPTHAEAAITKSVPGSQTHTMTMPAQQTPARHL
ncbi:hypothetical protein [Pseudomonas sp. EL_65y_Pfl2_R95]|uniref:hypothetical protein n=1 Tax=Pseudomonas sp. EL_65y_Pfl2_R95 TaxID=3088698 RepID=UPI0030DB3A8E